MTFDAIRAPIEYYMEDMTLCVVILALRSKELDMKSTYKTLFESTNGYAFLIRGKSEKRDFKNKKYQSRSNKPIRFFICHKEGEFQKKFP